MKRLALLLGSLLVVSAAASAKEVVPTPVVVEETPVQVIEKEVIVYRDREPEWRPSGYVSLEQTYYGTTEGQTSTFSNAQKTPGAWNTYNNYMRTQLQGRVQMTQNQAIDFRTRLYQNAHRDTAKSKEDQLRVRYYYDHGTLGDTQIDAVSRLKYQKDGTGRGKQQVQYVLGFDFAKYMFNNEYVKTTKFVVGPSLAYTWADDMRTNIDSNGQEVKKGDKTVKTPGSSTAVGIYFNWVTKLPYGFGTQLEFDSMNLAFGSSNGVFSNATIKDGKTYTQAEKRKFTLPVKFLLSHSWTLWENDAYSLDWYAEGGYDKYTFSNKDSYSFNKEKTSKENYTLKFEPTVTLTYRATNFVSLYGTVGAEYSNWVRTNQTDASHWRWQPYATVGVKTTF